LGGGDDRRLCRLADRCALFDRRELPRDLARARARARRPPAPAASCPPGHRALEPDVCGARPAGRAPAQPDGPRAGGGGGTETTTERRILLSPEIPGRRIGESRSDWEILVEVAARAHPERASAIRFADAQAIRDEIGRLIPMYAGIEKLAKKGDQVQYGGRRLCEGGQFPVEGGRARFRIPFLLEDAPPP